MSDPSTVSQHPVEVVDSDEYEDSSDEDDSLALPGVTPRGDGRPPSSTKRKSSMLPPKTLTTVKAPGPNKPPPKTDAKAEKGASTQPTPKPK